MQCNVNVYEIGSPTDIGMGFVFDLLFIPAAPEERVYNKAITPDRNTYINKS